MTMYHAEMLINNNIVSLGDYISDDKHAIGLAWRRAHLVADTTPSKVLAWPLGTQEPHWWAEIKSGISLEKRAAQIRGALRKKTNTEEEFGTLKAELKDVSTQLKKANKKSKKKEVVVEKNNHQIWSKRKSNAN